MYTAFISLELMSRSTIVEKGAIRKFLFISASLALGCGIWTMHFVGMLAFHLNVKFQYSVSLLILSMIIPIVSSSLSFVLINRRKIKKYHVYLSGTVMALGIVCMHYTGINAVEMHTIQYDPLFSFLSILIAFVASYIAMCAFSSLSRKERIFYDVGIRALVAFSLVVAMSGMHYTGMEAIKFIPDSTLYPDLTSEYSINNTLLAIGIGITLFIVLLLLLMSSSIENHFSVRLKESEERYRKLVELSPVAIVIHEYGILSYVNPIGVKMLGADTMPEIIGKSILEFTHPDYHEAAKRRWQAVLDNNTHVEPIEVKFIKLDKQLIDVKIMGFPIKIKGKNLVQVFFEDISERKRKEKQVYQMAYHDSLTGLPNRRLFEENLKEAVSYAKSNETMLAVMFIDLDGFKQVNDTFGHGTGDVLLQKVAERLLTCVRRNDTVSRLAGDEFTILLPDVVQDETIQIAQRILETLKAFFVINQNQISVTPSIGISFHPNTGKDVEMLIHQADKAMYNAKKNGKNTYSVYEKRINYSP
jgi:diguanylate cyclase (GGDEF)-like protein/PAS domain S-box-containing protein